MDEFVNHYLKFPDEAAAAYTLDAAGIALTPALDQDIDFVGTIWSTAVLDGDGDVIVPAAAMAGWHVNLRLRNTDLPTALVPFCQFPTTPFRRFA
ncbi:MAG: hypothetical protein DHS20C03_06100 [Minwuia thermotolerans]|nr:MAG: hypothetical protein DHS20C03_06100 [Minwuia thermotolerans]